jgi:hypothetical protein
LHPAALTVMVVPAAPESGLRWKDVGWLAGAPLAIKTNAPLQNRKTRTRRIAVSFLAPSNRKRVGVAVQGRISTTLSTIVMK